MHRVLDWTVRALVASKIYNIRVCVCERERERERERAEEVWCIDDGYEREHVSEFSIRPVRRDYTCRCWKSVVRERPRDTGKCWSVSF